jgi:uncharacterized protein (TIGR03066 family)
MKILRGTALLLMLALLGSSVRGDEATEKVQEMLLGKWELTTGKTRGVLEFLKNGEIKMAFGDRKLAGKYKLLDATTMEVEMTLSGETRKEKMEFSVSKDEFVSTDASGRVEKFKRIK